MLSMFLQSTMNLGNLDTPFGAYDPGQTNDVDVAGSSLELFLSNIIGLITVVTSLALILYFVFGAINWIMSGGDDGRVAKARLMMTHAAIGLIIVLVGWGVVSIVGNVLGLDILNPTELIKTLDPNG